MTGVRALLDDAAADPRSPTWSRIYHTVCPQGSCSPAGWDLLPELARIAVRYAPEDRDEVLLLAGAVAGTAGDRYLQERQTLREAAQTWLVLPTDAATFVHRWQAALALEGDAVWGHNLDRINDEEFEVSCPGCAAVLYIAVGGYGYFASAEDYVSVPETARTPLLPADPATLTAVANRLYAASRLAGHDTVAQAITYVFGRATCPVCQTVFPIAEWVS
jgi:hypothetical protein